MAATYIPTSQKKKREVKVGAGLAFLVFLAYKVTQSIFRGRT